MLLLPATWEVEVEDHKFKANLGNSETVIENLFALDQHCIRPLFLIFKTTGNGHSTFHK